VSATNKSCVWLLDYFMCLIVHRQQVVFTEDHTFCCLLQHVSATSSTQRGTVRKAQASANAVLNSLHLTVTAAVSATSAIPNVDLVNVTSMEPGVFTVNLVVGSAPANPIMLGGFAISVMMDTTISLSASVSHVITNCLVLYLHYYNMVPFFCVYFQRTITVTK